MASDAVRELEYKNWRQFKSDLVPDLFQGDEEFCRNAFLFRGHKSADWKLESNFDRWFNTLGHGFDRKAMASRLLEEFRAECRELDLDDNVCNHEMKLLALGQHFGLP